MKNLLVLVSLLLGGTASAAEEFTEPLDFVVRARDVAASLLHGAELQQINSFAVEGPDASCLANGWSFKFHGAINQPSVDEPRQDFADIRYYQKRRAGRCQWWRSAKTVREAPAFLVLAHLPDGFERSGIKLSYARKVLTSIVGPDHRIEKIHIRIHGDGPIPWVYQFCVETGEGRRGVELHGETGRLVGLGQDCS